MKDFLLQDKSLAAQPHELVVLHLDIGQCRFIRRLLKSEFSRMTENGILDKNDAVLALLDHFTGYAYPDESKFIHRDEPLEEYIDEFPPEEIAALLSFGYIDGVLLHE